MIGNGASLRLGPGRPSVPEDSLEVILDTFVRYRNDLRKKRVTHRPKSGFVTAMKHSDTWWRKYAKDNYLHFWPLLPESDNLLVAVIFGQPDYWITWANDALCRTLGYERAELVDTRSALELLRGPGTSLTAEEQRTIEDLRAHPGTALYRERTYLVGRECKRIPIRLELHYTGPKQDRFLAIGEVLDESDGDIFNVHEGTLFNLTSGPGMDGDKRFTLTTYPQISMDALLGQGNQTTFTAAEFFDRVIPPYKYPGKK